MLEPGHYPRPQLVRPQAVLLDRQSEFRFDDADVGLDEGWYAAGAEFDRTIRLPFVPESEASGIHDTGWHPVVWYRFAIGPDDLADAGLGSQGDRLLLHFGAVDHTADVWVNGQHVAHHLGGQTSFSVDIRAQLATADASWLVVRAADEPRDVSLPRGKQDWHLDPHHIWYERSTGISRSLWIEAAPAVRVERLRWTTLPTEARVVLDLELNRWPGGAATAQVELSHEGVSLASARVALYGARTEIPLFIARQRNGKAYDELIWSPENPVLWDATVTVTESDGSSDAVTSYLGYRSVAADRDRFLLNDRPYFVRSVLEQGYWPATLYTAPSPAAMRKEVELIKRLGFNAARIHQKVEDPRFLYWCDRLGLLIWGEVGSAYEFSDASVQHLMGEWAEIVLQNASHPSIVTWVPLNESWGVQHGSHDPRQRAFGIAISHLTRALDSTRPVISNDGWEHTSSDMLTIHDYAASGDELRARYADRESVAQLVEGFGPYGRRLAVAGQSVAAQPIMVTEFGGVQFDTSTEPDAWGYSTATDIEDFQRRVGSLISALAQSPVLSGFCYTQLTDTRQEVNGLCDADRRPKAPAEWIARVVRGES